MIKSKDWLIEARINNGLTQQELAHKSGISVASIRNIEQGQRKGSLETWRKLHDVLDENKYQNDNYLLNDKDLEILSHHTQQISKKLNEDEISIWKKIFSDALETNDFDMLMSNYIYLTTLTGVKPCEYIMFVIYNKRNIRPAAHAIILGLSNK